MGVGVTGIPSTLDAWPGSEQNKPDESGLRSFGSVMATITITGCYSRVSAGVVQVGQLFIAEHDLTWKR